jgi:hypothetical protein
MILKVWPELRSAVCLLVLVGLVTACSPRKLDEVTFYEGPEFKLKLVRYYEFLLLHFEGEVFSVQCHSENTAHMPKNNRQDAGWRTVSNGAALESSSAEQVLDEHRHEYVVLNDRSFVKVGNGIIASFDACQTYRYWQPDSIPSEFVMEVESDCSTADPCNVRTFVGEAAVKISEIEQTANAVTFKVQSSALKEGALLVTSDDLGRSWHYKPLNQAERP